MRGRWTSGGRPLSADRSGAETEPVRGPSGLELIKDRAVALSFINQASMRGFEPPTYRLGGGRSILLSYMDIFII